jgi:transcriptional regulator of arginine metabolism
MPARGGNWPETYSGPALASGKSFLDPVRSQVARRCPQSPQDRPIRDGPVRAGPGGTAPHRLDMIMQQRYIYSMGEKSRRLQLILEIVQSRRVANQEQLAEALSLQGVEATQATLSRDLRELGVMKGPAGYTLPGERPGQTINGELERAVRTYLVRAESAGNLAVLHTGPGRAPLLALEIDRARLKPVLGTVAGDDTIFIVARSSRDAGRLLRDLRQMAGVK